MSLVAGLLAFDLIALLALTKVMRATQAILTEIRDARRAEVSWAADRALIEQSELEGAA